MSTQADDPVLSAAAAAPVTQEPGPDEGPEPVGFPAANLAHRLRSWVAAWSQPLSARAAILAVACVALAGIGASVWRGIVTLPNYTVSDDGRAVMADRGLTQFFAADAWFVIIGLIGGLLLGALTWHLFKDQGWMVALIAVAAGLLSALGAMGLGEAFGPTDFATRLSQAAPGAKVPIDFELHTWTPLLVWAFAAITPVLLYSSLGREEIAALDQDVADFEAGQAAPSA